MFYMHCNSSVLEAHAMDVLAKGLNIMIIALPQQSEILLLICQGLTILNSGNPFKHFCTFRSNWGGGGECFILPALLLQKEFFWVVKTLNFLNTYQKTQEMLPLCKHTHTILFAENNKRLIIYL